jgi:thioesterase III
MKLFECRLRVRSYELDGLGHVNHAVYLNYFEQARFEALEAGGFPPHRLKSRGWGVIVVRIEVDYLRECRQGDRLRVLTGAKSFRRTSMVLSQELLATPEDPADAAVVADGGKPESAPPPKEEPAARALVTAVWVGANGRPIRIPAEVRRALEEGSGGG